MTTAAQKKALEKKQAEQALALQNEMMEDEGLGYEQADSECFSIPFIKILQKMSPEVDENDGAYIEGARPGQFIETATKALYDGKEGINLIPCHFQRRFIHWKPRDEGGGYLGSITVDEFERIETTRDERGRFVVEDGTYYSDTREHYVLLQTADGEWVPAVIGMASTMIANSKDWLNTINAIRIAKPDGSKVRAPSFSQVYHATPALKSNSEGSWYVWNIARTNPVQSLEVYRMAKEFREAVLSGLAKEPDYNEAQSAKAHADDDVAF